MKPTKKHIKAVNLRLMQYEFSMLTGLNCFGKCEICKTIALRGNGCRYCEHCLLGNCCLTDKRSRSMVAGYGSGMMLDNETLSMRYMPHIKARYKEMLDHLEHV